MAIKKSTFFACGGCKKNFAAGTGITPPKNKYNLKLVCMKCFNQYIGTFTPLPNGANPILKNLYGGLLTAANTYITGGGLISNKAGGVISTNGGGLINKANPMVAAGGMNLVGHDGSSLIGQDGASIISDKGSGFRRK